MSAEIKIACPDCGKVITVKIQTIDRLREEVSRLKMENKRLLDGTGDLFNELFGMGRKR